MMLRRTMCGALVAVGILGVSAMAQQPTLLQVTRVQVKPDRVGEYIDISKQLNEVAQKGNSPISSTAYRGVAGNPNEFMFISPVANYAAMDDQAPWIKALPRDLYARGTQLLARRSQCVESVRVTYERGFRELDVRREGGAAPRFARVTRVRVRSGMAEKYMALVKDELTPAYKKANVVGYRFRRVQYGGSRAELTSTVLLEKMGDLDEEPLTKALGAEGARKYLEKVSPLVAGAEYSIYRRLADLSYTPKR